MIPASRGAVRLLFKGMAFFFTLAGIILLAHALDVAHMDAAWFDANIRRHGNWGIVLYIGLAAVGSACGIPRQALSFLGGYGFGILYGTVWTTLGTTAGCALGFFYARLLGRSFISRLFARRIARLNAFLSSSPFTMTLVIRSLPVGNNALTNLLGGLSSISATGFIAGSCIGYIPQNLIFAILGSGMRVDPFWRTAIATLLFAASSVVGYMLYRRHKIAQTLNAEERCPQNAEKW